MSLPTEKHFYVHNAFISALEDKSILKDSFEFHLKNGDFSNWVDHVLENPHLAKKIAKLKSQSGILKKMKEVY